MINEQYIKDIKSGYFADGKTKLKVVDGYPQELAQTFTNAQPTMTGKQARSFYESVNGLNTRVIQDRITIDDAIVELKMLKSRVYDKCSKGVISTDFRDFIEVNVDTINTREDLETFTKHFEGVCNYLKSESATSAKKYKNDKPFNKNANNNNKNNNYRRNS